MKKLLLFFSLLIFPVSAKAQTMKNVNLTAREQKIAEIAAFTATGNMDKLRKALNDGLNAGMNVNEIKEILIQMYAYAGFPRSLNGISAFMEVINDREKQGIRDETGPAPAEIPAGEDKYAVGKQNFTVLFGSPGGKPKAPYEIFAPGIEVFLKEHLFADIFSRGILSFKDREIATVSALAAMQGTSAQLRSHFNAAMNVGLSDRQAREIVSVIEINVGTQQGSTASEVLDAVLESRKQPGN